MTRQEKYPDTSTFHYFNANPKKRTMAGDCVFRAISTALDQPWAQTLREITEIALKTGYAPNDQQAYTKYLQQKGFGKYGQPRKPNGTKYTGEEWCKWVSINEPYDCRFKDCKAIIAHIGGHHIVCIKPAEGDGFNRKFKVHDTWNSTHGCIGNYWIIR